MFQTSQGVRCLEIEGNFVKVTAVAVYLEKKAIPSLAVKWKGKSVSELTDSDEFYSDIVTGPFDKLTQVTTIVPVTGKQFSEKSSGNCVAIWKMRGIYTDADAAAIEKYLEVFKDKSLPPGSSILLAISQAGSLTISLSKDGIVPEAATAVMENQKLGQALLETVIGKHGVSSEAKQSLASRISHLMQHFDEKEV